MSGKVKFILDAEEAKAVGSFLKVVDAQKKGERGFNDMTKEGKRTDRTLGDMVKTGAALSAGFFGIAGAMGAARSGFNFIVGMAQQYRQSVMQIGQGNVQLERTLRPLFALNENAFNTQAIRSDVMSRSTAFGQSAQAIADSQFLIESALGGMDESVRRTVRDQVQMLSLLGTDMPTAVSGAASALLIYKKNLDQTTNSGQQAAKMIDQLVLAADLSKASQSQIFQFVPRALQAGEARGFTFEESLSLLPTATAVSPSTEVATTAVANFFTRMKRAEEVLGIELEGNLQTQIRQIAREAGGDMELLDKIFERELSNFVKTLLNSVDGVTEAQRRLDSVTAGFSSRKATQIRSDTQSFLADIQGAADQSLQNLPAFRAQDSNLLMQSLRFRAAKIGVGLQTPGFEGVSDQIATIGQLAEFAGVGEGDLGGFERQGVRHLEQQLRAGGNIDAADFLRLAFGDEFGLNFGTRSGAYSMRPGGVTHGVGTSIQEARLFAELQAAVAQGADVPERFRRHLDDGRLSLAEFTAELGGQLTVEPGGRRRIGDESIESLISETRELIKAVRESTNVQRDAAERVPATAGNERE